MAAAVAKLCEALSSASSAGAAQDILDQLGEINMTLDILQSTKVGRHVHALRKTFPNTPAAEAAKKLVTAWKAIAGVPVKPAAASASGSTPTTPTTAAPTRTLSSTSKASQVEVTIKECGNEVRDNCRRLLAKALAGKDGTDGTVAVALEEVIFEECWDDRVDDPEAARRAAIEYQRSNAKKQDKKQKLVSTYQNRIRTRTSNLRKNNDLRLGVLSGTITVQRFAVMTADEMMTDAEREDKRKRLDERASDRQVYIKQGAKTTQLVCGKCKARDASYTQRQTRSADEPMTTFALCNACGHRWTFC